MLSDAFRFILFRLSLFYLILTIYGIIKDAIKLAKSYFNSTGGEEVTVCGESRQFEPWRDTLLQHWD